MDPLLAFSADYTTARQRFRDAASAVGCRQAQVEIAARGPSGELLSVDFARLGPDDASQVLVVSSATHGVEGFFGSAVQLTLLSRPIALPAGTALVLVHALNPYGFAHVRRVNEDNVDLNRNFLRRDEAPPPTDPAYTKLAGLLNPPTPPGGFEAFLLRAGLEVARHGMATLKNGVVGGQYEHAKGLFYGGGGATESQRVLAAHLPTWVGPARRVVHLDLHTGMGKHGTYVLAASHSDTDPRAAWLRRHFGDDKVQALDASGVLYTIRGVLGAWLDEQFPGVEYHTLLAEFGTSAPLSVLYAMRQENRAHHYGTPGDPATDKAKAALMEAFCPRDPAWRTACVGQALAVADQALGALRS
jgi:Protein of unknown function (DUF2817)